MLRSVVAAAAGAAAAAAAAVSVQCDVLVAGGSTASLAAAITAANVSSTSTICFTDPTDWPGGQMTASAVPAIDFGPENGSGGKPPPNPNLPGVFNEMMALWEGNPGDCWVSTKCFQPQLLMERWILPTLASYPNLKVYFNTAITGATRDAATGAITSVSAVQRVAAPGTTGWEQLTSVQLPDWYSPAPSAAFPTKTVLNFTASVVIDATEFGDVLATSGVPTAQGIEAPYQNSTTYIDYCGQGVTIAHYLGYGTTLAPVPDPVPAGGDEGLPFNTQGKPWSNIWTYRRIHAVNGSSITQVLQGEISNQNWAGGNDLDNAYLFQPPSTWNDGPWAGGINTTVYSQAEQRSYGWYHYYKGIADASVQPYLQLNNSQTNTTTFLPKMPYLRDTRRSGAGIQGFRLFFEALTGCTSPGPIPTPTDDDILAPSGNCTTAYHFKDTIGIGQYFYGDIHKEAPASCPYPAYLIDAQPVLPYYIPFRALTSEAAPNLLVAGKTMALTFWANAAVRLHPEEWVTGTAAGVAAVHMAANKWTSTDAYNNIATIQAAIQAVGSPLEWTL